MPNKISYSKLLEGVQEVIERGDYPLFLRMIKKMRNDYSFRNTLLVYVQNPNATYVKGFCDWNKLGRGVKKNPKTIYIYAPIKIKKNKKIDGQQNIDGKEEKTRNEEGTIETIDGLSFRRIAVFDIKDTYVKKGGQKIPFIEDVLNSNTTKELYNILIDISPVEVKEISIIGGEKGYYDSKQKCIAIDESLSQDDRTAVLIHELCHCLYDDFDYCKDRNKSEIFVESVAFLVADYFNFDTSLCSFGYITNWAKNDINNFMSLSNKIKETADEFINLIKERNSEQQRIGA